MNMRTVILALAATVVTGFRATTSMGLSPGDKFPPAALKKWGVSGKPSVVYFYGADESPSCTKQAQAFSDSSLGVPIVGVRNEKGVKGFDGTKYPGIKFVVDEDDEVRKEVGIAADLFGLLGGRETYVLAKDGSVASVFNNQFAPEKHIEVAAAAVDDLKSSAKPAGFDFGSIFGK